MNIKNRAELDKLLSYIISKFIIELIIDSAVTLLEQSDVTLLTAILQATL